MVERRGQRNDLVYALDIGTRSIVGVVGQPVDGKLKVLAVEMAEHNGRTMIDGQIDNIRLVAELARTVTRRLEDRLGVELTQVSVAAAGRALQTEKGSFTLELPGEQTIDEETIGRLEAGAVSAAEEALQSAEEDWKQMFLVGYTVAQYRLDNYPLTVLLDHKGVKAEVDVVATFLPAEVVESLYAAMKAAGLQVASMTLEPIAAMNAAIPAELRLLNLALVDIGAGTTDIAVCRGGSVVGYTMATIAGDEITEAIMKAFLVDFATAETIKRGLKQDEKVTYKDILGLDYTVSYEEVCAVIQEPMERLAQAIAKQVMEVNTAAPSALFLAGGGSKLLGLKEKVSASLGMDDRRVAIAGNNFEKSAFSEQENLENPEYTTPLGIAVSAGLGLLNDSYVISLNGAPAKLFRSGVLTARDVLMMNGYTYADMIGKTGSNLSVTLDGRRVLLRGEPAAPSVLTINGEPSALSAVVNAGDKISFTPARPGMDAQATLGELLGDRQVTGRVLLNNQEAELDTPLEPNDVILTLERGQAVPVMEPKAVDVPAPAVEPKKVEVTAPVAEWKPMETPRPVEIPKAVEPPRPAWAEPLPPAKEKKQEEPAKPKPLAGPLEVLLNGEPLVLPEKEDGQPFYMMDLLRHSGIDFDHLDRPVRLAVNGQECGFREPVKTGDTVTILCV